MQSQMELMEQRELREPMELMDEVLDVYVEHEVAYLEVDPTLIQGQGWCHQ